MNLLIKKIMIRYFLFFIMISAISQLCSAAIMAVQVNSMAQQSDGKIVTANSAVISNANEIIVVRYNIDGSFDSSFGISNNGVVTLAVGESAAATGIQLQSTGNIIVGGYTIINGLSYFAIANYNVDGTLNTSFGTNGIITQLVGDSSAAYGLRVQSDDKVVLAGIAIVNGVPEFSLFRTTSTGVADTSFGTDGLVTTSIGQFSAAQSLVIQPDGKIIVAGWTFINDQYSVALARYNSDGTLDTNFGIGGIVTTTTGSSAHAYSVALDSNGNIVVGGTIDAALAVLRYLPDGTLDTAFSSNGIFSLPLGTNDRVNTVLVQLDDAVVAIGSNDENMVAIRIEDDGTLDTSFGQNGIILTMLQDVTQGYAGLIQSDNKILAGGLIGNNALLVRYNTVGAYDPTWGLQGIVTMPGGTFKNQAVFIYDQKVQGTDGGTFTSGVWQIRDLNTIIGGTANISLINNQIILQPGGYQIEVISPAYAVGNHRLRLRNVTDGITFAYGSNATSNATNPTSTNTILETKIFASKPITLEVQHQAQITQATTGFGLASNFGPEIYTIVKIIQLS